jgi:phosphotriesterase-related protein
VATPRPHRALPPGGTAPQVRTGHTVETVTGPVDTAELGQTLMHEHVFVLNADVQQNYPEEWGSEDDRVADAVQKLTKLAATGVRTIVDPTVIGLGRYIQRIQRIAERVGLNIVVATGCYTYDDVPFFFHYRGPALNEALGDEVPDPMVDMFVGDIEIGIAGTGSGPASSSARSTARA